MPTVKFLLITANVGSLFEEATKIHNGWMSEVLKLIQRCQPSFIALHMQEIGGKDYQRCMVQVNDFIQKFYEKCSAFGFMNGRGYIDEDFVSNDKFTALGSLYLVHKDLPDVCIYNFDTCKFESVNNFKVFCKLLNTETTLRRHRFPNTMFNTAKWSRKGFMRTRWKIHHKIFNLVNIHLFHDACNIVAAEQSPSVYSAQRKEALQYALQTIEQSDFSNFPLFIFGDFNFRLDTKSLVEALIPSFKQKLVNDLDKSLEYRLGDASSELILRLGTKTFDHSNHENLSQMNLLQFDKEVAQFSDLHELRINFSPSYPFCEDVRLPSQYMKTRAPAWCDRILMNSTALRLVEKSSEKTFAEYNLIGKDICMGDHKPVYLSMNLAINDSDDCNSTGEHSRPLSSSFGINCISHKCFGDVCHCCACSCCNARCSLFCSHSICSQNCTSLPVSSSVIVNDVNDNANVTDDLKFLVSHFKPTATDIRYDRVENRHLITVNGDNFVSKPTICINPDLEFVTTITLYDDCTVSVMDASSYGLTLNNETPLDDRSIWWLTEKIKKSFSSFSDVSALKQISSGSSIPFYCKQQFDYHSSRRDAFGREDLSESASFCSEKFALMKGTNTNSFINEMYDHEKFSYPLSAWNNDGEFFIQKPFVESEKYVETLKMSPVNDTSEDVYSSRQMLLTPGENKMRIRIEHNDGSDRGENQQYSSIITIEGEGGEPEIVYGKPRIFEASSNLTFSQSSSNKTSNDYHSITKRNNCRTKLGFFIHPDDHKDQNFHDKTKRRRLDGCKNSAQFLNSVRVDENSSDSNQRRSVDEIIALSSNRGSFKNVSGRRRIPGRKFFEGAHVLNTEYVQVDWWAVNFLSSFNKSSRNEVDVGEQTYERRPLFDSPTETKPSKQVPCCRFL